MTLPDVSIPADSRRALKALSLLEKKWSPVVLLVLQHHGPQGFNDILSRSPEMSSKVLSETLTLLQNEGLVDRRVVSESPLRVKYERTPAGYELEPIFQTLADWVNEHLERPERIVMFADDDHRLTGLYHEWMPERYAVYSAHDEEEVAACLKKGIDVAVVDIDILGVDVKSIASEESYRTVLVVGDQPAPAELLVACDDVLRKPVVQETVLNAIEAQFERMGEPSWKRNRASLAARISFLKSNYSEIRLENEDAYRDLVDRFEMVCEST